MFVDKSPIAAAANTAVKKYVSAALKLQAVTELYTIPFAELTGHRRDLAVLHCTAMNETIGILYELGLGGVAIQIGNLSSAANMYLAATLSALEAARASDAELNVATDLILDGAQAWQKKDKDSCCPAHEAAGAAKAKAA